MIGSVDKGLDAEYIRKIIKIEKTQNTRCLQCKEYKENKCRICSCLFGNYENTGNCYIPSEINCELTRHVNNIFREKYSEEQVAMLRKHYRRELLVQLVMKQILFGKKLKQTLINFIIYQKK